MKREYDFYWSVMSERVIVTCETMPPRSGGFGSFSVEELMNGEWDLKEIAVLEAHEVAVYRELLQTRLLA